MTQSFLKLDKQLFEVIESEFGRQTIEAHPVSKSIRDNLNTKYKLRPYQEQAFRYFDFFYQKNFAGKQEKPYHLLYNMATGSGKTLIMAGLILELYSRGYRNFLFVVNSTNIVDKTKENFLNKASGKYLFNQQIKINGQAVFIKEVNNFSDSDDDIKIRFSTIHQIHHDLKTTKENNISYEDFRSHKVVILADEAHHLNTETKAKQPKLTASWENTVLKIHQSNRDNLLLDFTATIEDNLTNVKDKYQDKLLFKYDLKDFCQEKYSKEIKLFRSELNRQDRILQALILHLYRQELALANDLELKPVILFKSQRTIAQSKENQRQFHQLIESLTIEDIDRVKTKSQATIIQVAFEFFHKNQITNSIIVSQLQRYFIKDNCLGMNDESDLTARQIQVNSLEDSNNNIRAIFTVNKLNEGWDVLNLFDIVRLYSQRDSSSRGKLTPGKTTISEAQLIGRGARYWPFRIQPSDQIDQRKFDHDTTNDLRILEELYYHTKEDSRYISELKAALIKIGIDTDNLVERHLKVKPAIKASAFYQRAKVAHNQAIKKDYSKNSTLTDLTGLNQDLYQFNYKVPSGQSTTTTVFNPTILQPAQDTIGKPIKTWFTVGQLPIHVVRYALTTDSFFYFANLKAKLPKLESITQFITSDKFLAPKRISFEHHPEIKLTNHDYLEGLKHLLEDIKAKIEQQDTEFEAGPFTTSYIQEIFKDKVINVKRGSNQSDGDEALIKDYDWYIFNANYGTSEEKAFVNFFAQELYPELEKRYRHIYLIRNERQVKIVDRKGRRFEPDFLLFCYSLKNENLMLQIFIEPKGEYLMAKDRWKEDFLKSLDELVQDERINFLKVDKYKVVGLPFFNDQSKHRHQFKLEFQQKLRLPRK